MTENIYAISGLTRKRAELAGQMLILQEQLRLLSVDIEAIDRALQILDPAAEPRTIKPIRPVHRFKYFDKGEMYRFLLDTLRAREGKPASIGDLTRAIMAAKGLDAGHIDCFRAVTHRATTQLHSLNRRGAIRKIGAYSGVMWALPGE
ncbi:MAG TPA: hypothetical protein VGL35_06090 [Rhizomicrobium sp.]|jgi:hypothetical protein